MNKFKVFVISCICFAGFFVIFTFSSTHFDATNFSNMSAMNVKKRVKDSRTAGQDVAGIFESVAATESVDAEAYSGTETASGDGESAPFTAENVSQSTGTGAAVVQEARKYIDKIPYAWGGADLSKSVDCSGFTMCIYAKFGVDLPHNAAMQSKLGTQVSREEAQAGDLFFFGSPDKPHHVGIYSGEGTHIHAPETGKMVSESKPYEEPCMIRRYL
mgnify:CR=1 FL=1